MQLFLSFYFDLVTTITWPKANVPEKELAGTEKKKVRREPSTICVDLMKSRALICRRPDKVDQRDLPTAGPRQQAMKDGPPLHTST